jgi:hypothetical protein
MKDKMDLLLEREKIKAGFAFKEMDQLVEQAYKDTIKSYRSVFIMGTASSLLCAAGIVCFWIVTSPVHGWMWYVAWMGDVMGATTVILRAYKDLRDHQRFIQSHVKWQKEHKEMLKKAGIPVIAPEEKSAPQERVVN